jgi:hypothetical protein
MESDGSPLATVAIGVTSKLAIMKAVTAKYFTPTLSAASSHGFRWWGHFLAYAAYGRSWPPGVSSS